jgi:hypothetical protein
MLTATSQLPACATEGKTLSMVRSGSPLSASTQSAKNHAEIAPGAGLLKNLLKSARAVVAGIAEAEVGCWIVGTESSRQRAVARQIAKHPENISCLGAVVDGRNGQASGCRH